MRHLLNIIMRVTILFITAIVIPLIGGNAVFKLLTFVEVVVGTIELLTAGKIILSFLCGVILLGICGNILFWADEAIDRFKFDLRNGTKHVKMQHGDGWEVWKKDEWKQMKASGIPTDVWKREKMESERVNWEAGQIFLKDKVSSVDKRC